MVKKPPCPVCRSKRWRKNSSGFYVCEFGHQLEGYQELVSEYDGTGGSTYLRKINRPKRKRKVKENVIEFLSGRDLEFYNVQALQLILRKQIHVMVHEIGCPAELEYVAHEYWTLYLSMQQRFKNSWQDDDTTNGPESGPEKGNDGTGGGDEEEEEDDVGQASGQDPSSKETQPQSFKDKSDQPEEEPDDLDNMDEYQRNESSSSESEANSEDDDEESTSDATDREAVATDNEDSTPDSIVAPRKRKLFSRPRDRKLGFTMQATIAICYLSAQHLKLPIVMGDFYRWIMDRTIPYYNAEQYVPQEMRGKARNSILFPKHRGTAVFYKATSDLTNQLYKTFGLVPRTPNVPPMVFRFVQELMLPVEVFPCAMRLYYIFHDKVAVQGRTMFQNYVNRDRSLNDPL
ncbi:Pol I core factor CF [Gryganskiella cystojenkinii]|nr:Pol I core factor CF [Gryganskiella cystojenkinii]